MSEEEQKQYFVERTFLSILTICCKDVCDMVQIKPKYLYFPKHIELMNAVIKTYKEKGIADLNTIYSYLKLNTLADVSETISDDYVPIIDYRKQFMISQSIILNNYKKKVIKNLIDKFNSNSISVDEYLKKMSIIQDVAIRMDTDVITEEELEANISTEAKSIELKKFPQLNKVLKLVQGDFLMIGASTGVGKSGLLLNFMNDLMSDYQCIYFNMEMAASTISKRIVSIHSGIPIEYVEHPISDYQRNSS